MADPEIRLDLAQIRIPFLDLMGGRPVSISAGRGSLALTIATPHLRELGIMHGGVLATLLDSVMGMAATSLAPAGHQVVTAQLNVNFIRPAWEGEELTASGEVVHAGRQTAVARGEVRNGSGTLVGAGSGTFLFVPHPDPAGPIARRPEANDPRPDR